MRTQAKKEVFQCCLQTISPLHIGTDEVYEPTGFVVDASVPRLVVVEPVDLIKSLPAEERQHFARICAQGTIGSILEVYKFLRNRKLEGRSVAVCKDFVKHYQGTLSIPDRNERHVQQELNRFEIPRTAFQPIDGRAYIPGSSIKGALRTAYLNLMEKEKSLSQKNKSYKGDTLQYELLDYRKIPEDPFRMVKVSDFRPVGHIPTKVIYAVNEKKKPSERAPRGQSLLMEMIAPGATFIGEIIVDRPEQNAPIHRPVTMDNLLKAAKEFYNRERNREISELDFIGVNMRKIQLPEDVWFLRCGRHSGAESVTVEGHRNIRIMGKRGDRPKYLDHATTFWLASEQRVPKTKDNLFPMGWAVVAPLNDEMAQKCRDAEARFQQRVAAPLKKPKLEEKKSDPSIEDTPSPKSKIIDQKKASPKEIWNSANLTWDAGSGTLTAKFKDLKATARDKNIIPEPIQARLFKKGKKKPVIASVEVEAKGNAFIIVSIKS